MENQRPKCQHATTEYRALDSGNPVLPGVDIGPAEAPRPVAAGEYAHGTILLRAIVEVNPDCQHALHHFDRWLDMHDPGLHGPSTESGSFTPMFDGNREILVEWHLPIGHWSLIEQDCSYREALRAQDCFRHATQAALARQQPHASGNIK